MFGENAIVGQETVNIDERNRMTIPKRLTKAEPGEELFVTQDEYILSAADIDNEYRRIKESTTMIRSEKTAQLKELLKELGDAYRVTVDKSGRITVKRPEDVEDKVTLIGEADRIKMVYKKSKCK